MNDLRTGQMLGTRPSLQVLAQCFGVLAGSVAGCLAYRMLVPDPAAMLLTAEWPAPAVAIWKAVAEVLSVGIGAIPTGEGATLRSVVEPGQAGPARTWVVDGNALSGAMRAAPARSSEGEAADAGPAPSAKFLSVPRVALSI